MKNFCETPGISERIPEDYIAGLGRLDSVDIQKDLETRSADFLALLVASRFDIEVVQKFPRTTVLVMNRLALLACKASSRRQGNSN